MLKPMKTVSKLIASLKPMKKVSTVYYLFVQLVN